MTDSQPEVVGIEDAAPIPPAQLLAEFMKDPGAAKSNTTTETAAEEDNVSHDGASNQASVSSVSGVLLSASLHEGHRAEGDISHGHDRASGSSIRATLGSTTFDTYRISDDGCPMLEATLVEEEERITIQIEPSGPIFDAVLEPSPKWWSTRQSSILAGLFLVICILIAAIIAPRLEAASKTNPPSTLEEDAVFPASTPSRLSSKPPSNVSAQTRTIKLADGRTLAYCQYGANETDSVDIKTVIHSHGNGGSRLEWPGDEAMLKQHNISFISIDRPGIGLSDSDPNRTVLGWAADVEQLLEHLNIDKFYVQGWSSGGPYALAIAHELQSRVIKGALLGSIAPYDKPNPYEGLNPHVLQLSMDAREGNLTALLAHHKALDDMLSGMSAVNIGLTLALASEGADSKEISKRADLQHLVGSNTIEGYRQGYAGPAQDDLLVNQPWGFQSENIQQHIDVWYGALDSLIPLNFGTYLASVLPYSEFIELPDNAHFFPLVRWEDILVQLVEERLM